MPKSTERKRRACRVYTALLWSMNYASNFLWTRKCSLAQKFMYSQRPIIRLSVIWTFQYFEQPQCSYQMPHRTNAFQLLILWTVFWGIFLIFWTNFSLSRSFFLWYSTSSRWLNQLKCSRGHVRREQINNPHLLRVKGKDLVTGTSAERMSYVPVTWTHPIASENLAAWLWIRRATVFSSLLLVCVLSTVSSLYDTS